MPKAFAHQEQMHIDKRPQGLAILQNVCTSALCVARPLHSIARLNILLSKGLRDRAHLQLGVPLQSIGVLPIAAVVRANGGLHIHHLPGLWPQHTQESCGVHGPSPNLREPVCMHASEVQSRCLVPTSEHRLRLLDFIDSNCNTDELLMRSAEVARQAS